MTKYEAGKIISKLLEHDLVVLDEERGERGISGSEKLALGKAVKVLIRGGNKK